MIVVTFDRDVETISVSGLWQWDYGQIIEVHGLELPPVCTIDFSTEERGGNAIPVDAVSEYGVTRCEIPNSLLNNESQEVDYKVYAFIRVIDAESNETVRKIKMKVKVRPKPDGIDIPVDRNPFEQAVEAVREYAETAQNAKNEAVENAKQTQYDRQAINLAIVEAKKYFDDSKYYAQQSKQSSDNAKASLQELKDGIASGDFKGKDGVDGQDGKDGHTPVKGTDYFTVSDKREIVEQTKTELEPRFSEIEAIAKGATSAKVFDTESEMRSWIASHGAELTVGTNLLIRQNDVPDYWWDGVTIQMLESSKVDLTEYAKKTDVPSNISELTQDDNHQTVSQTEKETWSRKSDFSGSYNDLKNKPPIPDAVTEETVEHWGFAKEEEVSRLSESIMDISKEVEEKFDEMMEISELSYSHESKDFSLISVVGNNFGRNVKLSNRSHFEFQKDAFIENIKGSATVSPIDGGINIDGKVNATETYAWIMDTKQTYFPDSFKGKRIKLSVISDKPCIINKDTNVPRIDIYNNNTKIGSTSIAQDNNGYIDSSVEFDVPSGATNVYLLWVYFTEQSSFDSVDIRFLFTLSESTILDTGVSLEDGQKRTFIIPNGFEEVDTLLHKSVISGTVADLKKYTDNLLEEYVKNTDYASYEDAGVVRVFYGDSRTGINTATIDGKKSVLQINPATNSRIDSRTGNMPITPENLEYAVKSVGDDIYVSQKDVFEPYVDDEGYLVLGDVKNENVWEVIAEGTTENDLCSTPIDIQISKKYKNIFCMYTASNNTNSQEVINTHIYSWNGDMIHTMQSSLSANMKNYIAISYISLLDIDMRRCNFTEPTSSAVYYGAYPRDIQTAMNLSSENKYVSRLRLYSGQQSAIESGMKYKIMGLI